MEIVERPAEPFMVLTADKTEPGAFNHVLYLTFCDPMYCSGLLLSPDVGKGFTFTVVDVNHTEAEREITLHAPEDLYNLAALLRDTGRFVVKSIHSRAYPNEQAAALSTTRLKHIAGRYVGKDDPVAVVRTQKIFPATEEFGLAFSRVPFVAGDCRGSHNMPLAPVPINTDSSIFYCLPMVSAAGYSVRDGILTGPMDLFNHPVSEVFREEAIRQCAEGPSGGRLPAHSGGGGPQSVQRSDGRRPDELRPLALKRRYTKFAEGSVLIELGDTRVVCTASLEERVPPWLRGSKQGWLTAEYGMLPRATQERSPRDTASGRTGGRAQEIQRLIGRSLRAVIGLDRL